MAKRRALDELRTQAEYSAPTLDNVMHKLNRLFHMEMRYDVLTSSMQGVEHRMAQLEKSMHRIAKQLEKRR